METTKEAKFERSSARRFINNVQILVPNLDDVVSLSGRRLGAPNRADESCIRIWALPAHPEERSTK
jgi:hypothetical protein